MAFIEKPYVALALLICLLNVNWNDSLSINYGSVWFTDMVARLSPNEGLVSRYYFYWTNFFYLPFFYFTLASVIYLVLCLFHIQWFMYITLSFLFCYNLELYDFLATSRSLDFADVSTMFINTLLTNTLNKYHPFLFYVMTLVIFITIIGLWLISRQQFLKYHMRSLLYHVNVHLTFVFSVLLTSLMMGGWWALQEGSWGGWWDWDPSEMLGLMFLLTVVVTLHTKTTQLSTCKLVDKLNCFALLTTLCYYLVQLNFEFVSHNFGIKSFFLFNNNMIFLESFAFNLTILVLVVKQVSQYSNYYLGLRLQARSLTSVVINRGMVFNFVLFASSLLFLYFWLSFLPLINYFSNNFWSLDIIAIKSVIKTLNAYAFLTFLVYFYHQSNIGFSFNTALAAQLTPWGWLASLLPSPNSLFKWTHFLLQAFFLLNLAVSDTTFSIWENTNNLVSKHLYGSIYEISFPNYTCNGRLIELTSHFQSNSGASLISENLIFRTNAAELETFLLTYSNETCSNSYQLTAATYAGGQLIAYPGAQHLLLLFVLFIGTLVKSSK